MNCREFIIEFEDRANLSEPAQLHLTICTDCRRTSEKQTQIWLMIDELKPIAAPTDFDFHVKRRIAKAKPDDFKSPRLLPILRYVLPLSVAVLLVGILVFNSGYFSANPSASPIAQNVSAPAPVGKVSPVQLSPTNQPAAQPSNDRQPNGEPLLATVNPPVETSPVFAKPTQNKRNVKSVTATSTPNRQVQPARKSSENGSNFTSHDSASTSTVGRIPKEFDSKTLTSTNIEGSKPVDDENVLNFFGIATVSENGKRTVKTIDKNSAAEYSGVKVGDVIEKVKDNAVMIARGTEKMEIVLQNKTDQKP